MLVGTREKYDAAAMPPRVYASAQRAPQPNLEMKTSMEYADGGPQTVLEYAGIGGVESGYSFYGQTGVQASVIGKAKPKGFFYVDRQPGDCELSTTTEARRNLNLRLSSGEEKYVRLEPRIGVFAGHIKPVLVEKAVGMEEIQDTKHIGIEE